MNATYVLANDSKSSSDGEPYAEYEDIVLAVCELGHQFANGDIVAEVKCLENRTWSSEKVMACDGTV